MNFWIDNPWMLFGLFALAVPIILHLLQRRRFDTLDWGAMQFLPDSTAAQRKRWLDEILLMLLRMAMIALIVIALATPISTSAWLAPLGDRSSREVVVVIDGSYSMDLRVPGQPAPWTEAIRVAEEHREAVPSDRFTLLIARNPPQEWHVGLDELAATPPQDNPDMPRALAEAWKHLKKSNAATKEIIVLTDGQRHGWADSATLTALDNLGSQWRTDMKIAKEDGLTVPSLRVVKVGGELPKLLPNYALAPLTTSRGVAKVGQKITFRSALYVDGLAKFTPPSRVSVEIDGEKVHDLALPKDAGLDRPIPLSYSHQFKKEGQYVVAMTVEADPASDYLPADNKQQVIEVVKDWPILLVDGDDNLSDDSSTLFLERALAAEKTIPHAALKPATIGAVKPAVIVLADVPHLDASQIDAIERFLAQGGGLLILAGERVASAKAFYNDQLYRNGQGWLPAKLGDVAAAPVGVKPDPRTFQHPALEALRGWPEASLREVSINKWWKLAPGSTTRATVIGKLSNDDPFLLEMPYKQGRVIFCTVPPDRRWNSTLPRVGEFLILAYELTYYLGGNRHVAAAAKPVNPADLRESNLTRCSAEDWRKVREKLPIEWREEPTEDASADAGDARREELWWLLLLAVVGLLCSEVWLTRRMALARGR